MSHFFMRSSRVRGRGVAADAEGERDGAES
jgi:hypothetical protein